MFHTPSSTPGRWSAIAGAGITLVGIALLLIPVGGRDTAVPITGWALVAAGLLEFASGLKSSRAPVRRIELLMAGVTLGAALLVLLRPAAYPLVFVAITCLAIRGVGAVAAAFFSSTAVRWWVLARGAFDILLAAVLTTGAPLSAVISTISGAKWPRGGAEVLTNFVAVSILAAGLSLLAIALTGHKARGEADPSA
jgi:uncharacterized membrane protein HdeD (DUF308 family)